MPAHHRPAGRTKPGPRRDRDDVRSDIVAAARDSFSAKGFRGTTLRSVAEAAGVDVALIPYYFGSKAGLFAATLSLPVNPAELIGPAFEGDPAGIGERVARTFVGAIRDDSIGPALLGLMRSAIADESARDNILDFINNVVLETYAAHVGGDIEAARQRAALAATQILGVAVGRHILQVPELVALTDEELIEQVAPTLQRHLGPLS